VLEDAREQRMSLCQSLRQYVFVHRAIVEGALALVDELRGGSGSSNAEVPALAPVPVRPGLLNRAKRRRSTMDEHALREAGATLSKRPSLKRDARA
jgi:hypothetical protein